jgi:hypothetical protein
VREQFAVRLSVLDVSLTKLSFMLVAGGGGVVGAAVANGGGGAAALV